MWEELGYESKEDYEEQWDLYEMDRLHEEMLEKNDSLTEAARKLCRKRIESYMEEVNERNELQEDS